MRVDEQGITPDQLTDQQAQIADAQRMAPTSAAPVPPVTAPVTLATPAAPAVIPTPAAPVPTPDNRPHPLSRALDAVLKSATGGDVYYIDPNGERKLAPQSRGSLGKTLIAATLAGLLAPDKYRETPYGPVRDWAGTAAGASEASQGVLAQRRAQPQKLSDEAQTKKLMTIQNNSNLVALQTASANLKHAYQEKNAAAVIEGMSPFKEYEDMRTSNNDPSQPKAFLAQGLSNEQVLAQGPDGKPAHKLSDSNVIQDGWVTKWNETTQQMEPEPTYAVLNPDLKDITLPKNVTDMLNKVNSQWKDIHAVVGGTVKVPVSSYVSAMHDYQAVIQGQHTLEILNQTVNGKSAKPLTTDAVAAAARTGRDSGANILPALYNLTHAVAGGNLPEDGNRPDNLLHTLLTAPNGADILKLIGLTPEEAMNKADDINAERVKQLALAKEGGVGDKSPAPPEQVQATRNAVAQLPEDDQKSLNADFNPLGTTVGELKHINDKVQQIRKDNKEMALREGDPVELEQLGTRVVFEQDPSSLDQVLSARQNVRMRAANVIHDIAEKAGLDTTMYTPAAMKAKADTYKDYSGNKKGSTGSQITSFNAFLGHTAGAVEAEKRLENKTIGLTNTPMVNTAMDVLAKQAFNDADWKAYETSLLPVQNEISNFLSAGYAVKEEDARLMRIATDQHETPARITASLRQLAETADVRLAAMGQRYLDTEGTTYRGLISSDSANSLKRLNINSRAVTLGTPLPRGWQNGQPTTMTDLNIATAFVKAVGGDKVKAQQLAKAHGWILK